MYRRHWLQRSYPGWSPHETTPLQRLSTRITSCVVILPVCHKSAGPFPAEY